MNWILLSLLPLLAVRKLKNPGFAAANGQFMVFTQLNYIKNWWHYQVKNHLVEDMAIIHRMKKQKFSVATVLGDRDIFCRMYSNYKEGIYGFSKNIIHILRGNLISTILLSIYFLCSIVFFILYGSFLFIILYCLSIIGIRIFTSLTSRQPVLDNFLLHIPQMFSLAFIVTKAISNKLTNK